MRPDDFRRAPVPAAPLRVTDRDRDATIGALTMSYTTGRLTKVEHDGRVGAALTATTYGQLDQLTADLPDRPDYPDAPAIVLPRSTNKVAVAALVCGLAQPLTGMITTIPAIALGHVARGQIRRTGDDGKAMATWGAVLGWAGLTAVLAAVAIFVWFIVLFAHAATGG